MGLKSLVKRALSPANFRRVQLLAGCVNQIRESFRAERPRPVPPEEIRRSLEELGVRSGDSLMVHSSVRRFYLGGKEPAGGKPIAASGDYAAELLALLLAVPGDSGVLMMPTDFVGEYAQAAAAKTVFNLKTAPSNRGYLTELLRRKEGARRSNHPIYNLTVYGRGLEAEISNHWNLPYSMDVGSPWHRFMELGGKILLFGVDYEVNSFIHMPEYLLKQAYPRAVFHERPFTFVLEGDDGRRREVEAWAHKIHWTEGALSKFCRHLNTRYGIYRTVWAGSAPITVVKASDQHEAALAELRKGTCWYDAMSWV